MLPEPGPMSRILPVAWPRRRGIVAPRSAGSGSLVEDEGAVAAEVDGEGAASGASGDSAGGDSGEEAGGAGEKEVLVWVRGCCGRKDGRMVLVVGREDSRKGER